MHSSLLPGLALVATVLATPLEVRDQCSLPIIFWARGATEQTDNSAVAPWVNDLAASLPANSKQIDYPASVVYVGPGTATNIESVNQGIANTISNITAFVALCQSRSQIILMGGSQGGQVMTDTLAGGYLQKGKLEDKYRQYSEEAPVTPWSHHIH